MKIIIKGDARVTAIDGTEDGSRPATPEELKSLHQVDDQTDFMEYFNPWGTPELKDQMRAALSDGAYMHFEYDSARRTLVTFTIYESNRKLTPDEEQALIDYTSGQWSDGIGEGFEQFPVTRSTGPRYGGRQEEYAEFYISPWFHGQKVTLEYKE